MRSIHGSSTALGGIILLAANVYYVIFVYTKITLFNPRHTRDILLLHFSLAKLENGAVRRIPNVDPRSERHRHMVKARPIHEMKIEVVQHVRSVQDFLGSGAHLAGVGGLGGDRFAGRV